MVKAQKTQTETELAQRAASELAPTDETGGELEQIVEACSLASLETQGRFQRAFTLAWGIQRLRDLITADHMKAIMALQGTRLGFRTDKDKGGGYPVNVVKDRLIEAVLRGVHPTGNEFNIIANGTYVTKEGRARQVNEFPGLTDLRLGFDVPKIESKRRAVVRCKAAWKLDGNPFELERVIPVKIDDYSSDDQILGKANRKLLTAVYERLIGSNYSLPDGDVDEQPPRHVDAKALPPTNGGKEAFGFMGDQEAAPASEAAGTDDVDPKTGEDLSYTPPETEAEAETKPKAEAETATSSLDAAVKKGKEAEERADDGEELPSPSE